MKLAEGPELAKLVTFAPNRREPIHNWYWFKEGFSRGLVDLIIDHFALSRDSVVLDPFCGVGTTNLACKQRGIQSIGFDINPLAVLASKVKTADYNPEELFPAIKEALKWKFTKPQKLPNEYFRKAFSRANLEYTVFYKEKISQVENPPIRDFLLLALIDAATKGSWTVREGALLRIKRRPVPPVGKLFKYKIKKMLRDLKKNPLPFAPARIELCDARTLKLKNNSIDCVITSPPYLNMPQYSPKIYKLELSLFFGIPPGSLKGAVGAAETEKDIEPVYWSDIRKVFHELYRVCRPGAKLAWVVGGGCFPHRVVPADIKTAELAGSLGFRILDILVARRSWCTRKRTIKVGRMSESVILLKKS